MRHLISLLILFSAIGSYAIGLAKPAETLAFVAMGLELWFWVRVRRAIKTDTVSIAAKSRYAKCS